MSAQPEALRLADELEQFREDTTPGKWGKGSTTHETVATQTDGSKYHIADFRHAADAAFVDMAHRQARGIAAELRRLHAEVLEQCRLNGMGSDREAKLMAENEANDRNLCQLTDELAKTVALLRQAWAVIRWQCLGECRTEGVEGLPTPSEVDIAIRRHLNKSKQ